jgi:hypothetical protein
VPAAQEQYFLPNTIGILPASPGKGQISNRYMFKFLSLVPSHQGQKITSDHRPVRDGILVVEMVRSHTLHPSRQRRNVLPETGYNFLFHTHIPSLTGRREMRQPVFSTNILCLRHKGDIFFRTRCCNIPLLARGSSSHQPRMADGDKHFYRALIPDGINCNKKKQRLKKMTIYQVRETSSTR